MKERLIEFIRSVPITDKTYAEYVEAVADALIKKVFPYDVVDPKCYSINAKAVYEEIRRSPTADVVEVRHGYWLSAYEYSLRFDISEEHRKEVKNDTIWKFCCLCEQSAKWDYNYCPNCGAKMDGGRREG